MTADGAGKMKLRITPRYDRISIKMKSIANMAAGAKTLLSLFNIKTPSRKSIRVRGLLNNENISVPTPALPGSGYRVDIKLSSQPISQLPSSMRLLYYILLKSVNQV
jgi:hypothetical protein